MQQLINPQFIGRVTQTQEKIEENAFVAKTFLPNNEGSEWSKLVAANTNLYNLQTASYATDFENFNLGNINNQLGWTVTNTDSWIISENQPFSGNKHVQLSASNSAANGTLFSPVFDTGNGTFSTLSAQVKLEGYGTAYEFIAQHAATGLVVTRIKITQDGKVYVLDANAEDFVLLSLVLVFPLRGIFM